MDAWYPGATRRETVKRYAAKPGQPFQLWAVVEHITDGTNSDDHLFDVAINPNSSAHFLIRRDGVIIQYVSILDRAWANGIAWSDGQAIDPEGNRISPPWARLRNSPGTDPNKVTISIEEECKRTQDRTPVQEEARMGLLRWIRQQTGLVYVAGETLIGHNMISPIARAFCPGPHIDLAAVAAAANREVDDPPSGGDGPRADVRTYRVRAEVRAANIRNGPTTDGRVLGALAPGDLWSGVEVVGQRVTLAPYGTGDRWVRDARGLSVWRLLLEPVDASAPPPLVTTPVIGVPPSISPTRWLQVMQDWQAPLSETEAIRIYTVAEWLEIDPAYLLAAWRKEQGIRPMGGSEVGQRTHNPLNIKDYGRWPDVRFGDAAFNAYESWQLGWLAALLHLKQFYGAAGLTTVEAIVPIFAPSTDGNNPQQYVDQVRAWMQEIQRAA